MNIRRIFMACISMAFLITTVPVSAQFVGDETICKDQIVQRLSWELRDYRQAIFGSTGSYLTKSGETIHRTGGATNNGDRYGIIETPRRLTSELIEPLVESYRTLRCRSIAVCENVQKSFDAVSVFEIFTVQPLGCREQDKAVIQQCYLSPIATQNQIVSVSKFCQKTVEETLKVERAVLKVAIAYDTGYRSLLQFTGMFDEFLEDVPVRTFTAFRQMVGLLGKLHKIPCFLGQCDLPPQETSSSSSSSSPSS